MIYDINIADSYVCHELSITRIRDPEGSDIVSYTHCGIEDHSILRNRVRPSVEGWVGRSGEEEL
jgi:hypothetical protein